MSYKYDIFISYKRHPMWDPWFVSLKEWLEPWLSQELHREASIFLDQEDIKTGDDWREKISSALAQSRCMVCVWSPLYFQSQWCVAEWQSFAKRCDMFKRDLVVPARYHDGEHYPEAAQAIESADFSKYTSLSPRFWDSELALEFEQKVLRGFAITVRNAVSNAPEFNDDFPIVDNPDEKVRIRRPKIERPAND